MLTGIYKRFYSQVALKSCSLRSAAPGSPCASQEE